MLSLPRLGWAGGRGPGWALAPSAPLLALPRTPEMASQVSCICPQATCWRKRGEPVHSSFLDKFARRHRLPSRAVSARL